MLFEQLFARVYAYDAGNLGSIPSRNMFVSDALIQDGDDLGTVHCTTCTRRFSTNTINLSHTASREERHFIPVTSLRAASCSSGTFSTKNGAIPAIENIIFESSVQQLCANSCMQGCGSGPALFLEVGSRSALERKLCQHLHWSQSGGLEAQKEAMESL